MLPEFPSPETPGTPPSSSSLLDGLALRDPNHSAFEHCAAALLAAVSPDDPQGRLLTELLLLAADRLRRAALLEPRDALPDLSWCRFQSLADRNFRAASRDLHRHLDRLAKARRSAKKDAELEADGQSEPPTLPPLPESTPEEIADASANWRKHIALVRSVSEEWPILLRLRREVEDVAAWLLDGKPEEVLMRWYPGLTRADIASCRACDAEGLCGPFDTADGPYPPGLPVLDTLPDEPDT